MNVLIVFLVIGGWAAIILRDFSIARGVHKGTWVHLTAATVFDLLLIWIAMQF